MSCSNCSGLGKVTSLDGLLDTCFTCGGDGRHKSELEKLKTTVETLRIDRKEIEILLDKLVKNEEFRIMLYSIGESSPIMSWAKSIDGVYMYANKALAEHLFYGDEKDLIGRNDYAIAEIVRKTYPEHNFGSALCLNSDKDCLEQGKPMMYYEFGIVRDAYRYVIAYKAPFYDEKGVVIGTCGVARYCDEEVIFLQDILSTTTCEITKAKVKNYLEKFMFADSVPVAGIYENRLSPSEETKMAKARATWYKREYK